MSDQEEPEIQDPELQDSDEASDPMNRLAMLRLASHHPPAGRCTFCGGGGTLNPNSAKRRSPSSLSPQDPTSAADAPESEPRAKKIFLDPSPPAGPAAVHRHHDRDLLGFTKIPLPFSAAVFNPPAPQSLTPVKASGPVLRRCVSDPVSSPGTQGTSSSESFRSAFSSLQSPQSALNSPNAAGTTPSPAKPPLHPTLRRSVSDPTTSASPTPPARRENQMGWMGPRVLSPYSSSGEMGVCNSDSNREGSPNSKRLRRMRERMREMSQWWDQVMREGEEEEEEREQDGGFETNFNNKASKDGSETETEEAVSVENVGDCLCIHFKCPCSKGYQILLSGKNCYYKLV